MSDSALDGPPSRDYVRIGLVVCCLLATVLAGALVPALTGGSPADSPAGSLFTGRSPTGPTSGGTASGGLPGGPSSDVPGTAPGGLGALDPGDRTAVGGAIDGGAYRSQDTAVHMTVRSTEPAYWRTGAYDTYTGSGWERTTRSQSAAAALGDGDPRGTRVQYQVTLARSASAVPTVWRPTSVDGPGRLRVTGGRALRSVRPLDAGTTYTAVSHRPPRAPDLLRATGRDYPDDVAERYGTTAASARLEALADDVTAGAGNPYAEARAIERWLETEKAYSLNASRTGGDVAETFVFEMERGYCEYFATSMAVMLRTQGIPARYVVGYSTGQRVGENTYSVRGLNAHAWVEVYFEDVGWVKFDPTPGSARLDRERQSVRERQPGTRYAPRERGSPGEAFTPDGTTPAGQPPGGGTTTPVDPGTPELNDLGPVRNGTTRRTADGYELRLNRSAVPGATVQVSVTRDGSGVGGATVAFNGDPVGRTDRHGIVTGTVPYARQLHVTVREEATASFAPPGAVLGTDRAYRVAQLPPGDVTVPVETNASVTVTGERVPDGTVGVTATVGGFPVRNAAVLLDGRAVARTDEDGRARVTLPSAPGPTTVAVARPPVRAETTVVVPDLEVTVGSAAPLALPLTDATVTVRSGGDPVGGAAVRLDGRRVATTGPDGTATVSLPPAPTVTVSATAGGLTDRASVSPLVNLLAVFSAVALVAGGGGYAASRRGYTPGVLLAALRRVPGLAVRYATRWLVALARRASDAVSRARDAPRDLLAEWAHPARLAARVRAWVRALAVRAGATGTAGGRRDAGQRSDGEGAADPHRTVRAAWRRFVDCLSVGCVAVRTPGELAHHAVERDGLPADAVRELRDAFRDVEYGDRPPEDRVERVQRAITAIERADAAADEGRDSGAPARGDGPAGPRGRE